MKQFKTTGKWNISLENFKRIMDIPIHYRMCDIDSWVLKPIQKELGEGFNLKIKKVYNKKSKGRPSVSGFIFTFKKDDFEPKEIIEEKKIREIDKEHFENNFLHRKVRMFDKVTEMFNVLTINSIKVRKDGVLLIKVMNVDDMYPQTFEFEDLRHFENWFGKTLEFKNRMIKLPSCTIYYILSLHKILDTLQNSVHFLIYTCHISEHFYHLFLNHFATLLSQILYLLLYFSFH